MRVLHVYERDAFTYNVKGVVLLTRLPDAIAAYKGGQASTIQGLQIK